MKPVVTIATGQGAAGLCVAAVIVFTLAVPVRAQDDMPSLLDVVPPEASSADVERFCSNIADAARERRYAIQKSELERLRGEIEERISILENKRSELEKWVDKRQRFSDAASEGLVEVYAQMRPDAAAQRMEQLPAELSAALLSKLTPRSAGTILNEMSPDRAATVTVIMAAVAGKQDMRK